MRLLPSRRGDRPRRFWIALLTLGFAALVVLPEAVSASGITAVHRAPSVPSGLRARRAVVLRPHRLDLVDSGRVTVSVPIDGTQTTLGQVVAAVRDSSYLARTGSLVVLKAALVQRPGTSLAIGPDGVHTVRLAGRRGSGVYFLGTGSALTLNGVALRGDPAVSTLRPYLQYAGGSRVTVQGSTFAHLGRRGPNGQAALDLGTGSRASVSSSSFTDDETGIAAHGTAAVSLQHVTVARAVTDGITLQDAGVVDVTDVHLVRNRRSGLVLGGLGSRVRTLRAVVASGNGHAGLMVTDGAAPVVTGLRSDHDGNAGVVLRGAGRVSVQGMTSTSDATAVRVRDGQPATISDLTATGVGTAVSAEGRAEGLVVHGGSVHGAKVGVRVQSAGVRIDGLRVLESDIGIESGPSARGLQLSKVDVTGPTAGTGTGIVVGGPSANVTDVHVSGGRTGLRIEGRSATLADSTINAAGTGILVAGTAPGASLDGVNTYGTEEGLRLALGADQARVLDSSLGGGTGLRIGARDATVTGGSIQADSSAVVVDTSAGAVTLAGTSIRGAQEGIRMAATRGALTLDAVQVTGSARTGLELDAGTTEIHRSTLSSAGTTIDAGAEVFLDDANVTGRVGVHVAPGVAATLIGSEVRGGDVGVLAAPGSRVTLTASQVYGGVPVRGSAAVRGRSFVAAMPLNWLGIAGIALVVVAVLLMLTARARERGRDVVSLAPAHVINRA